MVRDYRSALAKSRDEWMESEAGRKACIPHSCLADPKKSQFLRNRIESAFIAGAKAATDMLIRQAASDEGVRMGEIASKLGL